MPTFECLEIWGASTLTENLTNTPDLCYEGAVFFPPSSAEALDGSQYLGLDCQEINPEFAQLPMLSTMQAGVEYCVKFYVSVCDQTIDVPESIGLYFSAGPLTGSPFELGLNPHVEGAVTLDPTQWTSISGTYTAQGNETHLVVSGYGNTTSLTFSYIYVDQISVVALPALLLESQSLCQGSVTLDASALGATYQWSDGTNEPILDVTEPGNFSVTRTIGGCAQTASAVIIDCIDLENPIDTSAVIDSSEVITYFPFYVPNAFTPNDDGINDALFVVGPANMQFEFTIYSRWGEILFTTISLQTPWNGGIRNGTHYAQDGAYIWRIKTTGKYGEIIDYTGHVTVLR